MSEVHRRELYNYDMSKPSSKHRQVEVALPLSSYHYYRHLCFLNHLHLSVYGYGGESHV